jgi:endonuclease/exonuclease/phosphatase (EEP) superfamily protein YafD
MLAVTLADGTFVVDTHVSYDERHADQVARLLEITAPVAGPTIVCGDFNAERARCATVLGPGFLCAAPGDTHLHTRPRGEPPTGSDLSKDIDHVFVRGLTAGSVK